MWHHVTFTIQIKKDYLVCIALLTSHKHVPTIDRTHVNNPVIAFGTTAYRVPKSLQTGSVPVWCIDSTCEGMVSEKPFVIQL